jgi:hypothetical protein
MNIISKERGKDILGNSTTIMVAESELLKLPFYEYVESLYPKKDFYLDRLQTNNEKTNTYQIVFVGKV